MCAHEQTKYSAGRIDLCNFGVCLVVHPQFDITFSRLQTSLINSDGNPRLIVRFEELMLPGLKRFELGFLGVLRRFVSESNGCYPRNPRG